MGRQSKFEIEDAEVGSGVTMAIAGDLDLSMIPLLTQRVDGRLATAANLVLRMTGADIALPFEEPASP